MAQRFGGKHSPNGTVTTDHASAPVANPATARNAFDGKRRSKAGGKSNLLFFAPLIFVARAFQGTPDQMILGLGAGALMILGAWLTREGIFAQEAYDLRKVARRPAFPRKMAGSVFTGLGLALGAMMAGQPLLYTVLFAVAGFGLHLFAFGPDPLKDKGMEGIDAFQTDRVARAVEEAEKHLAGMKDAILRAGDRVLEARVEKFATIARTLFRSVEGDPGDLTAARKYLSVYLQGARDATAKFADVYAQNRDAKVRGDYEALLADLETTFAARTTDLLANNNTDLDVEIQVLRERLQYETPKR